MSSRVASSRPIGQRRTFVFRITRVVVGTAVFLSAAGCVSRRLDQKPVATAGRSGSPPESDSDKVGVSGPDQPAGRVKPKRSAELAGSDSSAGSDSQAGSDSSAETDRYPAAGSSPIRLATVRLSDSPRISDSPQTAAAVTIAPRPVVASGDDPAEASAPVGESDDGERAADQAGRADHDGELLPPARPSIELVAPGALTAAEPDGIRLRRVIESVHRNFPLVEAVYLERDRTAGEQLAARGAFDTKLNASTENQPLGFYETYRHRGGVTQPLYGGADVYGGYRAGRGVFEPWYQERQTNDGGEFSAGITVPLARNRAIDARRAELWRTTYDRQIAEPAIRLELISIVRDAAIAYWEWVAAGQQYQIGRSALELAEDRNDGLESRVEAGDIDPPVLKDNRRAIADRQSALLDRRRRFEQAAVKLSLYLRGDDASPISPTPDDLPSFPEVPRLDRGRLESLVETALLRRPELQTLELTERRLRVDLAEAANDLRPNVDAGVKGSQDVGAPTSPKRDKSEFELAMGLYFELPVQRRKGTGKLRATRAKLAQLDAKRRFTLDKIATEVQAAIAALDAAAGQVERTRESVSLAEELAEIERIKFSVGESDLLAVFLRERFAIEAADKLVVALLRYHAAQTNLLAAIGNLWADEAELESAVQPADR